MSDDQPGGSHADSTNPIDRQQGSRLASWRRGFTLQPDGRKAMVETAERIGSAVGSAQRQMRRGLELVRPTARSSKPFAGEVAEGGELDAPDLSAFDEFAGECFEEFRERLGDALASSSQRARQLTAEYPGRAVAAIAGFCCAFGVVSLLLSFRHR